MEPKFQILIFTVFAIIIVLGIYWIIKTEKRLKNLFRGKKGKDLEETILLMQKQISFLEEKKQEHETKILLLQEKLKKSIRGLETIRFNPFPDQGGNQSFAIGFLNEEGDGVVISSLYSRERMSVFAKPIKNGKSEYELSNEEKNALERAKV